MDVHQTSKNISALNETASEQSQTTEKKQTKTQQLMDYVSTDPKAYIRYYASDMILNIDSDAAYLIVPKLRSRMADYYHLTGDYSIA